MFYIFIFIHVNFNRRGANELRGRGGMFPSRDTRVFSYEIRSYRSMSDVSPDTRSSYEMVLMKEKACVNEFPATCV